MHVAGDKIAVSKVDFDEYSESYDGLLREKLAFFEKDERYFARHKIEIVRRLEKGLPSRILEYGCGIGRNIGHIRKVFPNSSIYGCDISKKSLEVAQRENPDAKFFVVTGTTSPTEFDLVLLCNVLHHVPPAEREALINSLTKLLVSKGSLFVFEHNPLNPVTRKVVNNCPFDSDAVLLKPKETRGLLRHSDLDVQLFGYCLFFPGFLKSMRRVEKYLAWLPIGGQYFIKAQKA